MKKLLITSAILAISYLGFSQVTPSGHFRIADRVTAFGINIPVGTQIYCISDSSLWEVKSGLTSTDDITSGLVGPAKIILIGKATNLSVGTQTGTTLNVNSSTGTAVTLPAADGTNAGLMTAAEYTKLAGVSGSNTGDQTITLTGDVTGSGTGSFATTIGANKVTLANMATVTTNSLLGRSTAGTGNVEVLTVGSGLSLSGGTLTATNTNAGTVTSVTSANGDATVATTTTTPVITIVSAPKLTTARAINGVDFDGTAPITVTAAAGTLSGTTLNSTVVTSSLTSVGTLTDLTVTNPIAGSVTGNAATVTTNANLTGDVTSSGSNATTIANNAVTYAKMQAVTTNKLLGSGSGTAVAEITLGTGLSFSGSTLNTTGVGSRYIVESFEEGTGGSNITYTLANTPNTVTTGLTVQLNGVPLIASATVGYTNSGTSVVVKIPVYKYDKLTVSYTY